MTEWVKIPNPEGKLLVGRRLGYYYDSDGHVIITFPELVTASHVFPQQWVHTGRAKGTCHVLRYAIDGYDPTPLEDGSVPDEAEPTYRPEDIIALEPLEPIRPKRNQYWRPIVQYG
ncbi:MAG: hypothetical protein KGI98_17585 [Euryarchaeota archaeon]|nr:hypothetical protein [Euryarchaeota archaeon]